MRHIRGARRPGWGRRPVEIDRQRGAERAFGPPPRRASCSRFGWALRSFPSGAHGAPNWSRHLARAVCADARAGRRAPLDDLRAGGAAALDAETVAIDVERELSYPGQFPFTRGVYPSMYRGRLWTMRQFAGFGTAAETNERFRYLLEHGQTGLSTAFDMPTLMGYDSDHAALARRGRARGRGGRLAGRHAETLFDGIPLGEVSTSMTINAPAAILLAYYVCVGEQQGVSRDRLRGTIQTDILKEYIAQKEYIFPPEPSMRLVTDMVEFCTRGDAAVASDLDLRLPHPRGGLDGGAGARVHADGRLHVRGVGARARPRRSTSSRRGCRSSSTRTSTSSRRSRSTGPPAGSGRRELRDRYGAQGRPLAADAVPRPDRRRLADRAAAAR